MTSSPHSISELTQAVKDAVNMQHYTPLNDALERIEEQLEARDRWAGFTHRETQDMHHALRMFAKFPGLSHEEQAGYTALADEIWNRHAAQVAALNPASEPKEDA